MMLAAPALSGFPWFPGQPHRRRPADFPLRLLRRLLRHPFQDSHGRPCRIRITVDLPQFPRMLQQFRFRPEMLTPGPEMPELPMALLLLDHRPRLERENLIRHEVAETRHRVGRRADLDSPAAADVIDDRSHGLILLYYSLARLFRHLFRIKKPSAEPTFCDQRTRNVTREPSAQKPEKYETRLVGVGRFVLCCPNHPVHAWVSGCGGFWVRGCVRPCRALRPCLCSACPVAPCVSVRGSRRCAGLCWCVRGVPARGVCLVCVSHATWVTIDHLPVHVM